MANAKHLARLEQGVAAWNAWRRRSPTVNPDLSRAFLIEAELLLVLLFQVRVAQREERRRRVIR